ncbi:MAG TPA: response regulator transcription factor [Terriglobales bacterium]|jgi:DNA-binding NarL/FixJ family response regulator|nr:response regulator transcription factor [Terriglobales bacterium]
MSKRLALILADHHQVVRDSIANLLEAQPDMQVVAVAGAGSQVPELVERHRPDVLVLELDLPELTGLEVLRTLGHAGLSLPTLILTASDNEVDYVQAVRLGASGLVLKRDSPDKLFQAIRNVAAGQLAFSNEIAQQVVSWMAGERMRAPVRGLQRLSQRERAVAVLVARGLRNREIAVQLNISENTVKRHLQSIFSKTGAHDRVELAAMTVEQPAEAA